MSCLFLMSHFWYMTMIECECMFLMFLKSRKNFIFCFVGEIFCWFISAKESQVNCKHISVCRSTLKIKTKNSEDLWKNLWIKILYSGKKFQELVPIRFAQYSIGIQKLFPVLTIGLQQFQKFLVFSLIFYEY